MDSRSANDAPAASPNRPELSDREREILILVATGASNKLIAQQLVISPNTVKVHLRNIFAKISVTSRTEAALYAIREGLVQVTGELPAVASEDEAPALAEAMVAAALPSVLPAEPAPTAPAARAAPTRRRTWLWLPLAVAVLSVVAVSVWAATTSSLRPTAPAPTSVPPTGLPRWVERAALPTARAGLAVATYENNIYAIGGEATDGVTGETERYNPVIDRWETLTVKPLAVADVAAAVIGGLIYVPGGRLADGTLTDVLSVYDPRADTWETRAALPHPLSAYALVAFEGHLYLFGGWDGERYVNTVLVYDPEANAWELGSEMPTARGFAGAAVAGGRIYVIGGINSNAPLTTNEKYTPEVDHAGGQPWKTAIALPEGRARFGIASVADIIHIIGGSDQVALPIKLRSTSSRWETFDLPIEPGLQSLGVTAVESDLYSLGGLIKDRFVTTNLEYQAVFTVQFP